MIGYNNSNVLQCLRQYEMFSNSLKLIKNNNEKAMIIKQLSKLEEKIIGLTNDVYLEEYNTLVNKECGLLDEEKNRLTMLIDLINQRLSYVEKRCNNHYALTGESIDVPMVEGADTLDKLEDRVRIIDKYVKNINLAKELEEDVKSLSNKIALASEKIDINKSLNSELESTLKKTIGDAIDKLGLYSLLDSKDEIEFAYYETEKSLTMAELNLEAAKTSPMNILTDCQNMLEDVKNDYIKYKEQMSILKLMEIFNNEVNDYDELLKKRKDINDILRYIKNNELLDLIMNTVSKQYNTIVMEQQDLNTFNDLVLEKERKTDALNEIDEENNSAEFQSVLKELIENERKKQEKLFEEQKRIEEIEKKKKLEIERKKQEEILKRQRIIEEARKKEIEKRTKQLLEEQQNSVLQKRKDEVTVSFETIKDKASNEVVSSDDEQPESFNNVKLDFDKIESTIDEEEIPILPTVKDKNEIEKELFQEFDNKSNITSKSDEEINDMFSKLDDKVVSNKFPEMSFDEYMKNFNEQKVDKTDSIFDNNEFPSIPM